MNIRPLFTAALVAATLAACSGTGSSDDGELPGRGEWILYAGRTTLAADAQIFRIRPDGTQRLQLTDPFNKTNDAPVWSADGNQFIFASARDFAAPAGFQRMLYKAALDGIVQTRVTGNSPQHCTEHDGAFSSDARMVVFTLTCDTAGNVPQVTRINLDGTGQVRVASDHPALAAPHAEFYPLFSADGRRIVFAVVFPASPISFEIYAMDLDGKNTVKLTNLAAEGRTFLNRLVLNGDTVYFETVDLQGLANGKLEAIKTDGTLRTTVYSIANVTAPAGVIPQDRDFGVAPSGRQIVFARYDPTTGKDILTTALADGTAAAPIDASGYAYNPAWK